MNRNAPLGLPAAFVACSLALIVSGQPAACVESIQEAPLTVMTLSPEATSSTNPVAAIWGNRLAALRAHTANKTLSFFNATFKDGEKTVLVSVSVDDPTCENYSGALARPTSYSSCPMRAAVLQSGLLSVVASEPHFGLPIAFDSNGRFDTDTAANTTTISYDPRAHEITISEVIDGKPATALDDVPSTIHLNY